MCKDGKKQKSLNTENARRRRLVETNPTHTFNALKRLKRQKRLKISCHEKQITRSIRPSINPWRGRDIAYYGGWKKLPATTRQQNKIFWIAWPNILQSSTFAALKKCWNQKREEFHMAHSCSIPNYWICCACPWNCHQYLNHDITRTKLIRISGEWLYPNKFSWAFSLDLI